MIVLNLILSLISLLAVAGVIWWLWRERDQIRKREEEREEILVAPSEPIPISELIVGVEEDSEVVSGSLVEIRELEMEDKPVEVREWENEQKLLRRRNQVGG